MSQTGYKTSEFPALRTVSDKGFEQSKEAFAKFALGPEGIRKAGRSIFETAGSVGSEAREFQAHSAATDFSKPVKDISRRRWRISGSLVLAGANLTISRDDF